MDFRACGRRGRCLTAALGLVISACSTIATPAGSPYPAYDPFLRAESPASAIGGGSDDSVVILHGPTPTLAPASVTIPSPIAGAPLATPTPDAPKILPTPRQRADKYVVQPGDTLGAIAQAFGVGLQALLEANDLSDEDILALGTTLRIPSPEPDAPGTSFKVIPDSELVYGPASVSFEAQAFVTAQHGYLSTYIEDVGTDVLSGAEIVSRVAQDYSVNPRLLLAVLEHRSGWVTQTSPPLIYPDYPLGFVHPNRTGLYRQLAWAANEMNRGYYLWRANAIGTWVLGDGTIVPIDPTINAGTAAIQSLFSGLGGRAEWDRDVDVFGIFQTYFLLFGNPFDMALEPLVPGGLTQPELVLPLERGVAWSFTGGPHAAWDSGTAWGALDFAPPDVMGCAVSQEWVTAARDGYVVRSAAGAVVQDLDGDGYEQTGWAMLYMHIFEQDRVEAGTFAFAGDRLGHPSCEGGVSNASHVHIARKFNGEWIPADAALPFVLDGWSSSGNGIEYDGILRRGSDQLEAVEGASEINQIMR